MNVEWFDNYDGPKALNRAGSRKQWKCILGGKCPVTTAYGDTPDEAVANCVALAKQTIAVRKVLAEKDESERPLAEWEKSTMTAAPDARTPPARGEGKA